MTGSHISLFSGVGMTDLAAEALGYTTIATAETDEWCQDLLAKRFPHATHFADVRHVLTGAPGAFAPGGWARRTGPLLISGGFPCQGVSAIGGGGGLSDPRSGLWSVFARIIHKFKPDLVLVENSPMLRSRGLDRVLCDLHGCGYDARWDCIPAASVGAPHLRDRIFIVAWPQTRGDIDYADLERPYLGVVVSAGVVALEWLEGHSVGVADEAMGKYITRLPRAGELRAGFVSERDPLYPLKAAKAASLTRRLFPTPTRSDGTGGPGTSPRRKGGKNLRTVVAEECGPGRLNPDWLEWMMGLPLGWTDPAVDNDALLPHPGWASELGIPRTTKTHPKHRTQRITALGNGLVPQATTTALIRLNES